MWIVTLDNPYYPKVAYFEHNKFADAVAKMEEWREAHHSEDGIHEAKVVIARVVNYVDIKTDF